MTGRDSIEVPTLVVRSFPPFPTGRLDLDETQTKFILKNKIEVNVVIFLSDEDSRMEATVCQDGKGFYLNCHWGTIQDVIIE